MPIVMDKKCSKCGETKSLSAFYRDRCKKSGLSSNCKECKDAKNRQWRKEHPESGKESVREWQRNNPDKVEAAKRKWKLAHPGRANEKGNQWRKRNPDTVREIAKRSYSKIISTPKGKLNIRMRNATKRLLTKGAKAKRRWEGLVGFTVDQLIAHIEKQFTAGMSWENYGEWHIDHVIPVSAFNFDKPEDADFKKCWALKNLQPMWAKENQSKNDKLSRPFQPSLKI